MKLVSLHNVSVSYEGIPALRNVTLDLFSDDFTGIIGPNGGGKTTLVKAILGMVPYSGRIVIRGRNKHTRRHYRLPTPTK